MATYSCFRVKLVSAQSTLHFHKSLKQNMVMKKIENYSRISGAVNVELLQHTHIIGVGAGGAYSLYESLARSAVGRLTTLDFDTVDDVNLARQGYEMHQLGKRKVDALGEHLKNVNAGLQYTG